MLIAFQSAGCDRLRQRFQKVTSPEQQPTAEAPAPTVEVDAGVVIDPAAPAGNLREEAARFFSVESCVKEHARLDPLVGDALDAIGYETFLADTCRLLEAVKQKSGKSCARIDASGLRNRCVMYAAIASGQPDACPVESQDRGRTPTCVAAASGDARLCAGEDFAGRTACDALVTQHTEGCTSIDNPRARALCERDVARWKGSLVPPSGQTAPLPPARGELRVEPLGSTPPLSSPKVDLTRDLSRGAVVVVTLGTVRVFVGNRRDSIASMTGSSLASTPHFALAVAFGAGSESEGRSQHFELELPGRTPVVSDAQDTGVVVHLDKLDKQRGGEVQLRVSGNVSSGTNSYRLDGELKTFVRDIVMPNVDRAGTPKPTPSATPTVGQNTFPPAPSSMPPQSTILEARKEPPPVATPPLPAKVADATTGTVHLPSWAHGHRVYLDGRLIGEGHDSLKVTCGTHELRVGSTGKAQTIDVPCGGETRAQVDGKAH